MIIDRLEKAATKTDWIIWLRTKKNTHVLVQIAYQATELEATQIVKALSEIDI